MAAQRIALHGRADPALVERVAGHIRAGELVVLPTETVYGLAVRPGDPQAVAAMQRLKGRAPEQAFTFHLGDRRDLEALAAPPDRRVARLVERYWPGPLTIVVADRHGGTIGLRLPAHPFTRAVIAAVGEPLWLTSVNRSGQPPMCNADAIMSEFGGDLGLIVDDGPSPLGAASTVIRCSGPVLEVLRQGILTDREVWETAADMVLFVCTGNTCRSPLAEALARRELAAALGIAEGQLLPRGIAFRSAGTGTLDGMPPSDGSLAAGTEIGLDLSHHSTIQLDRELAERADRIYGLASPHVDRILAACPGAAPKLALLDPQGRDIADPFGGDLPEYRRARDEITAAVRARIAEWKDWANRSGSPSGAD